MPASADVNHGELRVHITDPSGAPLRATVELICAANGYDRFFSTTSSGALLVTHLPFGVYKLDVEQKSFAPFSADVTVQSAIPVEENVHLGLATVITQVKVGVADTLLDASAVSSTAQIGSREIAQRTFSLPGRSVQDLVVSQPGWLYEGNAVLHPRGSEYQTQFVVDGIPLTDNRSAGFGPEIEADDLESMSVATAGYSAEYGRKLGGVVELNTHRAQDPGVHGRLVLDGGAYGIRSGFSDLEGVTGKNAFSLSAAGSRTDRYLNPVVPENYTNRGTTGDFSVGFSRDLTSADRFTLNVHHGLARFQVPNELLQQQAGQEQNRDNFETMGTAAYQHTVSPRALLSFSAMLRDDTKDLLPSTNPTPIAAVAHNGFQEAYFKAGYTQLNGRYEFKAGTESDSTFLRENFRYAITNSTFFDPGVSASFTFAAHRPDLEQSAWLEETARFGKWTARAGLRWDHYQLVVNENAFSPRFSLARYFPRVGSVVHVSFDRIFQTPSSQNILLSSSAQIESLNPEFLRLPVRPSRGNYYETGISQLISSRARLDTNVYRRDVRNFGDDDQLLNTGVSYPIAFDRAVIYGAEGKLSLMQLGRLSGFLSYSYMVGTTWFPVTGGLFLGNDAHAAAAQTHGHFPDSQDQRNTAATRFQYALAPRLWIASGATYGSGLPFRYGGDLPTAIAQYGASVISRLNFPRGRIRPQLNVSSSLGLDIYSIKEKRITLQIDGENLGDQLNVIDFGGLFSGNAIGPGRAVYARLRASF
ncbi:MAG: hypothetical protein NVSMB62_05070 [Acidobacteriaceae bacterium]